MILIWQCTTKYHKRISSVQDIDLDPWGDRVEPEAARNIRKFCPKQYSLTVLGHE